MKNQNIVFSMVFVVFILLIAKAGYCAYYLDIYEDGKMTKNKIISEISIYNQADFGGPNEWFASVNNVYIAPQDDMKKTMLQSIYYSTTGGEITNLKIDENTITFRINFGFSIADPKAKRFMDMTLIRDGKNVFSYSDVIGHAVWWSDVLKEKIYMSWKKSKEISFKVPYNTVY